MQSHYLRGALVLALALSRNLGAADLSEAWTDVADRFVLEAKPGTWQAQWIDAGPGISVESFGRVFYLRKTFVTQNPDSFRRVYLSADSKYKLWLNGVPAARGPARFDPNHQMYDTLDLAALVKPGTNTIAAEIIYWGPGEPSRGGPIFQMSARPAFVFQSAELTSDKSWRAFISPAQDAPGWNSVSKGAGYFAGNWLEKVDARKQPINWQAPDFDDSAWSHAREITRAEIWGEGDTRAPWKLLPRAILPMEELPAVAAKPIQVGLVKDDKEEPPFSFEVEPISAPTALPITIPADGKIHYVVFDAGKLVTAYPQLELEGGAGAQVEIMYTEAPSLKFAKGQRDVLGERRVEGYNDIYIARAGNQVYEPFLHRCFWFVRVAVKTPTPLTIRSFKYRWTSYAFPDRGQFECSDLSLNKIWQVGRYTARLCAHESYEDCPYYEQLQYVGDTRIQALVTYSAFGDTLLPAQAIRHIDASRLPEGLTYSRYPSHLYQVIPGFSLFWVLMLDDYYLYTGDLNLVREHAAGVYSVLRFFEKYQTPNGFIANVPYWNFHDWTFERGGVPPASKENDTLTTLLYKGSLDAGARLFAALGDTNETYRFNERAQAAAKAVNEHAWSEAEGLYTDGIATKSLSRHVNILAVLFDVANPERSTRIAERLFTDPKLRDVTLYYAHYLHAAADKLGQPQRIIDDMARWKSMLDKGTSTWWETPDNPRSECHAWSAAPTHELMQQILGVRPTEPGFAGVQIRPFVANLDWAKGVVPTPKGDLHVSWKRQPEFELQLTLPPGVAADIVLPDGREFHRTTGSHTLK